MLTKNKNLASKKINEIAMVFQEAIFLEQQESAGQFAMLPSELITDGIGHYLSSPHMRKLQQTCRFFKNHVGLEKVMQKKAGQWDIVSKGDYTYFIANNGHVYTVGAFAFNKPMPVYLLNKKPIVKIVPGFSHTFYMDVDGDYHVNGNNCCGQLGLGAKGNMFETLPTPFNLPYGKSLTEVVAGHYISFIRDAEGHWYGCGSNSEGQLGINCPEPYSSSYKDTPTFIPLPNNRPIIKIVTTHSYTFFQDQEGKWFGCGYNGSGQLGVTSNTFKVYKPIPITLSNHKTITDIVVGHNHTFILDEDGNCYGCGENDYGQLGLTKTKYGMERILEPTLICLPNDKPIVKVVAQSDQTFFCDAEGNWHGCGSNSYGQLGIRSNKGTIDKPVSIILPNPESIIKVIAASTHTFFLDKKNNWYATGKNSNRELGFINRAAIHSPMLLDFNEFEKEIESTEKKTINASYC